MLLLALISCTGKLVCSSYLLMSSQASNLSRCKAILGVRWGSSPKSLGRKVSCGYTKSWYLKLSRYSYFKGWWWCWKKGMIGSLLSMLPKKYFRIEIIINTAVSSYAKRKEAWNLKVALFIELPLSPVDNSMTNFIFHCAVCGYLVSRADITRYSTPI